jgi:pimeloyl-ACP methyl ester carboxylesterase
MEPFTIAVPDVQLDDLRDRLARAKWPQPLDGAGWDYGTEQGFLRAIVDRWLDGYDWRATEAELNDTGSYLIEAAGERVHLLHARSADADAIPLVLTHGWPGSIVEFLDALPALRERFHVVVPSMPGYGFSGPTRARGVDVHRVAEAIADVMAQLGYDRYIAQGGDWGALVTRRLGEAFPDRAVAIHCNMVFALPLPGEKGAMDGVTDADLARFGAAAERIKDGTGYMAIQSTRPDTLGYGLEDSPLGLAAWILEKFHAWCDTREGIPVRIDRLIDNAMLYWLTGTATSAARLYCESARAGTSATDPWTGRVDVPTGHAVYPYELLQTPRAWADRRYRIVHWTQQPCGGHFAAFEQPELFAADLCEFADVVRTVGVF